MMKTTKTTKMLLTMSCTTKKATPLTTLPTPKFGRRSLPPTTYPYLSIHLGCGSCLCYLLLLVLRPTCFSPYDTLASASLLLLRYCLFTLLVCFGTKSSNDQMILRKPLSTAAEPASLYHPLHLGHAASDYTLLKDAGMRKNTAVFMSAVTYPLVLHSLQMSVRSHFYDFLC